MKRCRFRLLFVSLACLAAAGCAVGPDYTPPAAGTAPQFLAPRPHGGSTAGLVGWWDRFDDPALPRLLTLAEVDSPSLTKAWAKIQAARATLAGDQADRWPSLTASGSAQRGRQQSTAGAVTTSNSLSSGLDASWEVDLFGKLRRTAEAAEARQAARTDDWHDARVSLAAEVADTYVQYRACQLLVTAYDGEAKSQQATTDATNVSVRAGFTSTADGALARASAASAWATLTAQRAECDVLVKSLVDLTGATEPALHDILAQSPARLPQPVVFAVDTVPAGLLVQRPDVASAERELAAASAEIGAAEADRYPSLSLGGSISRSGASLGSLMTTWLVGPSLSLPVFDAGKRAAAVDSAQAAYEYQLAAWRQSMRTAVKEVEQALVRLDGATRRTGDLQAAAQGYRQYFESIDRNWRAGGASLLDREQARRNALSAEISFITVQRDQIQYWIALYKALGGGWQPESPATAPASASGEQS